MKKKTKTQKRAKKLGHDHDCFWREASIKLAKCVMKTIHADGKLGVGTGMISKRVGRKTVWERWDKDFIEALNFIGFDVVDRPNAKKRRSRSALGGDEA